MRPKYKQLYLETELKLRATQEKLEDVQIMNSSYEEALAVFAMPVLEKIEVLSIRNKEIPLPSHEWIAMQAYMLLTCRYGNNKKQYGCDPAGVYAVNRPGMNGMRISGCHIPALFVI